MIKKMRNKMLLMSMISIFCLVIVAFTSIYIITYSHVQEKIDEALIRTYTFHRHPRYRRPQEQINTPDGERIPPEESSRENGTFDKNQVTENSGGQEEQDRQLRDINNFSVYVDSDGNVRTESFFGENSAHYEGVAKAALGQNASKGEFESEGIVWSFETRDIKDDGKIIALVDITAEKEMLTHLIISFSVSATVLLVLVFLISLHFANRAMRPVASAWDKQKQFVADASHELKTPLTAINANIDVLLGKGDKTIGSEEKWLRYIKTEVQRLSELTGNLLFMTKMDGDVPVSKMPGSVSELVESAVLNLEAVAFEKGVTLSYDIEKNISANINSAQITRLILILLDNAIKYSPKNETVTIKLKKLSKDHAALSVHNMGDAIPAADVEKIFDRFYRVDKSRSTSGYGLGLAMAKEIVQIHKGKISVKSSEEGGTEFTVILAI